MRIIHRIIDGQIKEIVTDGRIHQERPVDISLPSLIDKAHENIKNDPTLKVDRTIKDYVKAIPNILHAKTFGKEVSQEVQEARLKICSECEKLSLIDGVPACGLCGCLVGLSREEKKLPNLIALKETSKYGCKYPGGSKWAKAGL